jgi:hypothetical protein
VFFELPELGKTFAIINIYVRAKLAGIEHTLKLAEFIKEQMLKVDYTIVSGDFNLLCPSVSRVLTREL